MISLRWHLPMLNAVQTLLERVHYGHWYMLLPMLLLALCALIRVVCMALTAAAPASFGKEHRHAALSTARLFFWLSVFTQALLWVFGTSAQVTLLGYFNQLAACVLIAFALLGYAAGFICLFLTRRCGRLLIARSVNAQALALMLSSLFIGFFGWIFMK